MAKKLGEVKIEGKDPVVGEKVRYVPIHANGDVNHKDVEAGKISSFNDSYIFVSFAGKDAVACYPWSLIWGWV